jgi:hypothetical protein
MIRPVLFLCALLFANIASEEFDGCHSEPSAERPLDVVTDVATLTA